MKNYSDTVLKQGTGLALSGAQVSVFSKGTQTKAALYAADDPTSTRLPNPVATDARGFYSFFIANGSYDLVVSHGGQSQTYPDVEIYDFDTTGAFAPPVFGGALIAKTFAAIALLVVPLNIDLIRTEGHTIKGIGPAAYVSRPAPVLDPAALVNPVGKIAQLATQYRIQSADERWWELVADPVVSCDQLGMIGRPGFEANDVQFCKTISAYMTELDGVVIKQGRRTKIAVGEQTVQPGSFEWAYKPSPVIAGTRITGLVHIDMGGCTLRCRDGLRYGAFDSATGVALPGRTEAVFPNGSRRSSPYEGMFAFLACSGDIEVQNVTLDGNAAGLNLGGEYGDTGVQIPAGGLNLISCTGNVRLRGIVSKDHGQDGIQYEGVFTSVAASTGSLLMEDCFFDRNGRQGFSWIGGGMVTAINCQFNRTGYGRLYTNPGAGLDIEAEGGNLNRNGYFLNCRFIGNRGQGVVSEPHGSVNGDVVFSRCLFVGGGFWVVWPRAPGMKFLDCRIVGSMPAPYPDDGVASDRSTQFVRCEISNDPVYATPTIDPFLINGGAFGTAALFDDCDFAAFGGMRLQGLAGTTTRFRNCRFKQQSGEITPLRGTFIGDNVATGPGCARAFEAVVYDRFLVNGVPQAVSA